MSYLLLVSRLIKVAEAGGIFLAVGLIVSFLLIKFSSMEDPYEKEKDQSSERIVHDEEYMWRKSVNP